MIAVGTNPHAIFGPAKLQVFCETLEPLRGKAEQGGKYLSAKDQSIKTPHGERC